MEKSKGKVSAFFSAVGNFFRDFGEAVSKGDLFVKLSLIWMGAGYFRRKPDADGQERDGISMQIDRPPVRNEDPGDRAQHGGFPAAVFPDDPEDLSLLQGKGDIVYRMYHFQLFLLLFKQAFLDGRFFVWFIVDAEMLDPDSAVFHHITFT